ncbi:TetR/AcrR family transcriptional regulator [Microbacterium sp. CH1]|uniref:TetR/AcrR family transcriptional regulator n=1 Tax=Microbacterium sp. CH1 TaxID=1770208 RepID=UPI00078964DE|nr:TetR/AcrR family transcriptional regulator [Microbacterium sp. CH1]KYJ97151.1 hypothetical protein AUV07_02635 [Microbacterium sp. CH1]
MSDSRKAIIDAAIAILSDPAGPRLTLDSAARRAGLTKPGLMYHFPTKAALVSAVIEDVMERWSDRLHAALGKPLESSTSAERIAAYVDTALAGADHELPSLGVFFNAEHTEDVGAMWEARLLPWVTIDESVMPDMRGKLTAARLAADGYWFASSGGWPIGAERESVRRAIRSLIAPPTEAFWY